MKKIALLLIFPLFASSLFAQASKGAREVGLNNEKNRQAAINNIDTDIPDSVKNWNITGIISFNLGATGLVNWAAGGNNALNMLASANVSFLYHKNHIAWDSNIDTEFGESYLGNNKYPWQKTNDKLNLSTKFGWEFHKQWYLTALGSFKTQYAYGYDYEVESPTDPDKPKLISRFLSPSYTDISVGIDWKYKEIFSLYLSPIAGRITTCTDSTLSINYLGESYVLDQLAKGNNPTVKAEFGASLKAAVMYSRVKNLKILSTLTLFTPYNKSFGNIDVDWDVSVSYQFLKVLNVSVGTQLKYYDSVLIQAKNDEYPTQHVQFKAILGLGVGYSF